MTARQTGKRIGELSKRRKTRTRPARTAGRKGAITPKERRRLTQLMICGTIFVLLVAAKLLLPGKVSGLSVKVSQLLEKNMDVTEVFSAVGRAFSGERDVKETLGDVYQAVFQPQEEEAVETAAVFNDSGAAALEPMRQFADGRGVSSGWLKKQETSADSAADADDAGETAATSSGAEEAAVRPKAETLELSCILYSGENLPVNANLEQSILGFDFCTPVNGTLSSGFGYREHPVEGEERFHYGVDLAADIGTEVRCFAEGVVTAVGESSSYGKYLTVSHENGYVTLYAHCSRVVASSGAAVAEGQKIAEVGETGQATGPHLHFELHQGETYLNPIYYVSSV